jgi:hypothetical protein
MKSLDFLKEGFVEDASEAHQDHEVQMARQECFNTAENALALHKLLRNISEAQGLEGWVSSKITLANDYLKRVREYLEYEFLTKDINEITPQATIAENAEPKKKLIEYKIVSGQEGKSENYVITGLDTKTLDLLARAYYGAIKLEQDPKNPNVTTIVWDLPTAGPAPYGSYDAKSGTATFIKKMTDAGDQLAKSVKKIDQAVEEGRSVSAGIDNILSAKKLWQYVRRNLTDLASNAEFYADLNKLYIEDKLSNLFKTADGQQVKIAFTTGGGVKFDQGILYIPIGVMWYYRGMYTSESFVNGVINALNGKQEMEEGLDLDQQAMTVADQLTSGKNLEKLQAMRLDSTVYRALDRYFAKNNIPENIYNRVANIVFKRINTQGVAEGSLNEGQYEMMLRNGQVKKFVAKDDADAKRIAAGHGAKSVIKLKGGVPAGKISEEDVAEGKKCNHTMEGTQCPVHGLAECPMQENKKLKETSAGSVAGVNNPPGKNSGKKKSQIGSLFGGTYKQPVHETDFAGEKTTPPQKPGDQVRGTEKAVKKGKQQPFYHRLVGNE